MSKMTDLIAEALQITPGQILKQRREGEMIIAVLTSGHKYVLEKDRDGRPLPPEVIFHKPTEPEPQEPDDFTIVPWVGEVTSQQLHQAGYQTFEDLEAASNDELLAIEGVTTRALKEIRAWKES